MRRRLGQFRHAVNAAGDQPSRDELEQLLTLAHELGLHDREVADELGRIHAAIGALDLTARSDAEIDALITHDATDGTVLPPAAAPYFRAERYRFSNRQRLDKGYAVLVMVEGEVELGFVGRRLAITAGDTVLVPHAAGPLELTGSATVLVFRPPAPAVAPGRRP